jgi:hypothetical protein
MSDWWSYILTISRGTQISKKICDSSMSLTVLLVFFLLVFLTIERSGKHFMGVTYSCKQTICCCSWVGYNVKLRKRQLIYTTQALLAVFFRNTNYREKISCQNKSNLLLKIILYNTLTLQLITIETINKRKIRKTSLINLT